MSLRWLGRGALIATLLLSAGCFGKRAAPGEAPEDTTTRLPEAVSVNVEEWLTASRADLARQCAEIESSAKDRAAAFRDGKAKGTLLRDLRVAVQAPVFRDAEFNESLGFSAPDYVKPGKPDPAVALHLARHGDQEAALKFADAKTRKALDALKLSRNYPVEWTRLVCLTLADARLRLACGELDGGAVLVRVHEQLNKLLDDKDKKSPLGSLLLGQGTRALQKAARAWRDPARNKVGLAEDAETALASWGDITPIQLPPLDAAQLASVFGKPGKAYSAHGKALQRAADLLALPFPSDGLVALGAFADDKGRLASVQLAYSPGLTIKYPTPEDLGQWLEERGMLPLKEEKVGQSRHQEFRNAHLSAGVFRTEASSLLGALVTLDVAKASPAPGPRDPRSFGPAHFDLPFSLARDLAAPNQTTPVLTFRDKAGLARLLQGLDVPAPAVLTLQRESGADLVAGARLSWSREASSDESGRLLGGLWAAFGRGKALAVTGREGALVLQWEAPNTRVQFLAPFVAGVPALTAVDTRHGDDKELPARMKAALARAGKERKARLAAGKPDSRLEAGPETLNGLLLPGLRVGATRAQADAAFAQLPEGNSYKRTTLPDGVTIAILTPRSAGAESWARQLLVRFDGDKVSEVRVRYQEGLADVKKPETLQAKFTGDPRLGPGELVPATWAGLWSDVSRVKPTMRLWRDDRLIRTYQRDDAGSEATWRARPDDDAPARPWVFVSRGPKGVSLGDSRAEVVKALGEPAARDDDGEWFRMPAGNLYGMVQVKFDKDRATRILAVESKPVSTKPAEVLKALQRVWGRGLQNLGYYRRNEPATGAVLGAMFWHDDAVRVQAFVQDEQAQGAKVMTEWAIFPLPAPPAVKKPVPMAEKREGDIG